jgi:membrane fusion protein (multidrug efflux system)
MSSSKPASRAKWILYGVLAVSILLIIAFAMTPRPPEKTEEVADKPRAVTIQSLRAERIPDTVSIPGRLEAKVEADLAVEKPGLIVELTVDKGDHVQKGKLMLQVDDRSWKAMADKARIDLREADKSLKRWEELRKTGAVSVDEYDNIQARRELAAVALQDAEAHLERCRVISPCDGMVADRLLDLGEYAREGELAFKVVQIDPIKLVMHVSERDVAFMKPGQSVSFTVEALGGQSFTGQVSFISPVAARDSNSFRVEAAVANPDSILKPGMIARTALVRRIFESALAVPLSAVIPQKGEYIVFVVQDSRAVRRVLRIESIVDQLAVVLSGVTEGEQLVLEGARTLIDGAPVTTTDNPQ